MVGNIERLEKAFDSIVALSPQVATETLKENAANLTQLRSTMAETDSTQPPSNQTTKACSISSPSTTTGPR
jgi:hypothetical protein